MDISSAIDQLNSTAAAQRAEAAEFLATSGEDLSVAAVSLVRSASDQDEVVREWSVSALEELGAPDSADLPALTQLLTADEDAAYWAATLIGRMESQGRAAAEPLGKTLDSHPSATVKQRAAWALGKLGELPSQANVALQKAAQSTDARLQRLATQALEQ